jgi:hypothetical protein
VKIFSNHSTLAFFDKEAGASLQIRWKHATSSIEKLLVPDFVGGSCGDNPRLALAFRDIVHSALSDITHQHDDMKVGKQVKFLF